MDTEERDPLFEADQDDVAAADGATDVWDDESLDDAIDRAESAHDDPVGQMEELVRWLVTQLVDEPDQVTVTAVERGSSVQIQVRLPEPELGKVIGRGGRIAKAMRTALMIVGTRNHVRVSLDIEGQS